MQYICVMWRASDCSWWPKLKSTALGWSTSTAGTSSQLYHQIYINPLHSPTGLPMVHIFSPLVRIVKAGSSSSLWSSRLGLSSSFRRWNEYSQWTTVNPSMTSHGTPGWTHMTPLAVALRPAPKIILCSSGTHLSAVFKVATTVITGWGSCLWPMVLEYCQNSTIFWLLVIFHSGVQISCRGYILGV